MFIISANIRGYGCDKSVVCSFDPSIVITRLREAFPEAQVSDEDRAWRDYEALKERGAITNALQIAERDAYRRGPIWTFHLPAPGQPMIRGTAERYVVKVSSHEPIPEPLRSAFLAFLEQLKFSPHVSIKSVRIEGNDEHPT
jgi:hypothetical protein